MKLKKILSLMMGTCLVALLVSCTGNSTTKQTFAVDTGDSIELAIDEGSGFEVEYGTPYLVTKDGETYFQGGFGKETIYDTMMNQVADDEKATVLEESEKDGNHYVFYAVEDGVDGTEVEYDVVMKIAGSKTCALLASTQSEAETREAFESMTFRSVK